MQTTQLSEMIYLAGPWFKPEQMEAQQQVEALCEKLKWPFFSPRKECLVPPQASWEDKVAAFNANVSCIKECRLVLANVEGNDPGTIWEMGAAYAYNTPLVIYSPNPERKLNLMLAQGCNGFLAGIHKVEAFLQPTDFAYPEHNLYSKDFTWKEVQKWNQEIE